MVLQVQMEYLEPQEQVAHLVLQAFQEQMVNPEIQVQMVLLVLLVQMVQAVLLKLQEFQVQMVLLEQTALPQVQAVHLGLQV